MISIWIRTEYPWRTIFFVIAHDQVEDREREKREKEKEGREVKHGLSAFVREVKVA